LLLTLTCEAENASDFGYLLHKHPNSVFERTLSFGTSRVFYPEVSETRCTLALTLDVDPIELVRGRGATLDQYVNDRPYVANSLLSVALGDAFRSAMNGACKDRPDRVNERLQLTARLAAVHCEAGEDLIRRLLEPLGYEVTINPIEGEPGVPTPIYSVEVSGKVTVQSLLSHLYVLMPVMDNQKHYFVGDEEIEKLIRRGEGWLATHPESNLITKRYLRYRFGLVRMALDRLREEEGVTEEPAAAEDEGKIERPIRLSEKRQDAILDTIRALDPPAQSVLDLGCGEGRLIAALMKERGIVRIVGADVSPMALERAEQVLKIDRMSEFQKKKLSLIQASAVYADQRFAGFDAAVLTEVIEHVDPPRLSSVERAIFGEARPRCVLVTTPNADYNPLWETLPAGKFRHRDHRFEWSRTEFQTWANRVAQAFGYSVCFSGIGDEDEQRGCPTQMAAFDTGTS
jgi:3' terminal RNA ribose 2'-O-methyltransferase Hen1